MGDHTELKRLAEAAKELDDIVVAEGEPAWYDEGEAILARLPAEDREFIAAAKPQAILSLIEENERMRAWAKRVIAWAEAQAAEHEASAQDRRFPSLSDAYAHDAANLRKIASEGSQALGGHSHD